MLKSYLFATAPLLLASPAIAQDAPKSDQSDQQVVDDTSQDIVGVILDAEIFARRHRHYFDRRRRIAR